MFKNVFIIKYVKEQKLRPLNRTISPTTLNMFPTAFRITMAFFVRI